MALRLYRRHLKSCPHTAYNYTRCKCPVWVRGTLAHTKIRMSLDQVDWDAAGRTVSAWTKAGAIGQIINADARTLAETIDAFMLDCDARGLARDTKKKYTNLLRKRLLTFCTDRGISLLADISLDTISRLRATWGDSPLTKSKTQERLKWFFGWCVKRKWIADNPAEGLSAVKVPANPTLPFNSQEQAAILAACDRYRVWNKYGHNNRARMKAFVLVLRWTGLRIRDVCLLEWSRIQGQKVFLYTQKTGQPVYVPVPVEVITALDAMGTDRGRYVFWTGNGSAESVTSNWQRALRKLFESAKVEGGHAHRFRDTFAVELLLAGVDLLDVAILLGHSSIKTTQKHYAPWVAGRQSRLENAVQRTWPDAVPSGPAPVDTPAPQRMQGSATRARASLHLVRA